MREKRKGTDMRILRILSIALIVCAGSVNGFSQPEKYGQEITTKEITEIKNILAAPQDYAGKTVKIVGNIDTECGSGCWFLLKVSNGDLTIYVDIGRSGFAIPQYKGKTIMVEGAVVIKETGPIIQGTGVQIK